MRTPGLGQRLTVSHKQMNKARLQETISENNRAGGRKED